MTHGGRRVGAGRRPELGEPRTVRVILVLSRDEHETLRRAADAVPLAKWARERLLAAADE